MAPCLECLLPESVHAMACGTWVWFRNPETLNPIMGCVTSVAAERAARGGGVLAGSAGGGAAAPHL